mmetsp:Transcript_58049/g.149436  ORF Transcript_58049/g.149436 Transcript_58049/m.149436 type:complete len:91 (-) Transcript_58049:451-723(-)
MGCKSSKNVKAEEPQPKEDPVVLAVDVDGEDTKEQHNVASEAPAGEPDAEAPAGDAGDSVAGMADEPYAHEQEVGPSSYGLFNFTCSCCT